jgi:hypothetical protein
MGSSLAVVGLAGSGLLFACGGAYRAEPQGGPSDDLAGGNGGNSAAAGGSAGSAPSAGSAGKLQVGPGPKPDDVNAVWPSSGCGRALPAEQVPTLTGSRTGYTEWHVTETGATLGAEQPQNAGERQFFVRVPADYDPNRPYRVVYIGQGCGAQQAGKTNTFPLFDELRGGTEQAVYVGLSVPDNAANPGCYDNNTGALSQEWEAFELIHTFVERTYCVDNDRIFVSGYSTGGWLSNMWGCYFGGTPSPPLDEPDVAAGRSERRFAPRWAIRGRAVVSGQLPPNQPQPCNGPGAGLWIHDLLDASNRVVNNVAALELALKTNGCEGNYADGPKQPWAPAQEIPGLDGVRARSDGKPPDAICELYTGCAADMLAKYPLVFCTTQGFAKTDQASLAVPAFTRFFQQLDP